MSDKEFKEEAIQTETVFKGRLLHVKRDRVRLPDQSESTREYIVHPGAAVVIPILKDGKLVLVRQYRYAPGAVFYELPAGVIDDGEDHLSAAKRELLEETGYAARDWSYLGRIHPAIGYTDEFIALYLARDLEHLGQDPDEDEFLEVVELSLNEGLEKIRKGQITDAKTMVGLLWAEKVLKGDWSPNER